MDENKSPISRRMTPKGDPIVQLLHEKRCLSLLYRNYLLVSTIESVQNPKPNPVSIESVQNLYGILSQKIALFFCYPLESLPPTTTIHGLGQKRCPTFCRNPSQLLLQFLEQLHLRLAELPISVSLDL